MTASGYPELSLHTNGDLSAKLLTNLTVDVQQSLFDARGILAPTIRHSNDERLNADNAELWLDGKLLEIFSSDEIASGLSVLLRRHAADLVNAKLVEHYLTMLESKFPILVAAVRERIVLDTLIGVLQARLRNNETIHDLPGILEDLLASDLGSGTGFVVPESPAAI